MVLVVSVVATALIIRVLLEIAYTMNKGLKDAKLIKNINNYDKSKRA